MNSEKILFIDDDINLLESMKRRFRKDYHIILASNGNDAIEAVKREGPFAVIVCDYSMPGLNGVEILKMIRSIAPESTRIMMTGKGEAEVIVSAINDGRVFSYLQKPCSGNLLSHSIQEGVDQYRASIKKCLSVVESIQGYFNELQCIIDETVRNDITINKDDMITGCGQEVEILFGYKEHSLLGADIHLLLPLFSREHMKDMKSILMHGMTVHNKEIPVKCSVVSVDNCDQNICSILIHNASEQVPIEKRGSADVLSEESLVIQSGKLRDDISALCLGNRQHQADSEETSVFASHAEYAIRSLLVSVDGMAELLNSSELNEKELNTINMIQENGSKILSFLDNNHTRKNIRSGDIQLDMLWCSPRDVIEDVVFAQRTWLSQKGVDLEHTYEGTIPETIYTDPVRLHQIFNNVIKSSLGIRESGPVNIWIRFDDRRDNDCMLLITVSLGNSNANEEDVGSILTPSRQDNSFVLGQFGDSSIQLDICRSLVKRLGGDLSVYRKSEDEIAIVATVSTGGPVEQNRSVGNAVN